MQKMCLYDDSVRMFLLQTLREIDYLKESNHETLSTIVYSMKQEQFDVGTYIFKPGDISKCLIVIQNGLVELNTSMDNGTHFRIETIGRGVCMNYRTFLTEDEL